MSMYGSIHSHFEDNFDATTNMDLAINSYIKEGCKKVAATGHGIFTQFEDLRDIVNNKKDAINNYNKKAKEEGKQERPALDFEIIPGIEAYFGDNKAHMILIAKDYEGYVSLSRAISDSAFNTNEKDQPIMTVDILKKNIAKGHVICTSACIAGVFGQSLGLDESNLTKKYEKALSNITAEDKTKADIYNNYLFYKKVPKALKKDYNLAVKEAKIIGDDTPIKKWEMARDRYEEAQAKAKEIETNNDMNELRKAYSNIDKYTSQANDLKAELDKIQSKEYQDELFTKNKALYDELEAIFGKDDFYFELQNHGIPVEKTIYNNIIDFAINVGNPNFIASNDVHIGVTKRDPEYKNELLKRNVEKYRRFNKYSPETEDDPEYCIKNDEELRIELLKVIEDHGELTKEQIVDKAIANIQNSLQACSIEFPDKVNHYPKFTEDENAEFVRLVHEGIKEKFPDGLTPEYEERLNKEIEVITGMGYAGYHLIVQDYLKYGKLLGFLPNKEAIDNAPLSIPELEKYIEDNGYSRIGMGIGPGRGSAAGSLACYLLGITDIDPIRHGLLFERFLNTERVSMPDIDSDFKTDIREKVFEYTKNKYGEDKVCRIITKLYNESKAEEDKDAEEDNRMSTGNIRLAARYLYSKKIYEELEKHPNITKAEQNDLDTQIKKQFLSKADELSKDYQAFAKKKIKENGEERNINGNEIFNMLREKHCIDDKDNIASDILSLAIQVDGIFMGYGQHAAGVIISKDPIRDIIPLYHNAKKDNYSTQCQMAQAEAKGLLKMDFLGLNNLDIITEITKEPSDMKDVDVSLQDYSKRDAIMADKNIYEHIFDEGLTQGVFQFESPGMKDMLKKFKPDKFDDLVLLNAAYRPGPISYIPEIIALKWRNILSDEEYAAKIKEIFPLSNNIDVPFEKRENAAFYNEDGTVKMTPPRSISLDNEALNNILKNTYGCPIYQEQIMQIFRDMAGYSLGGADIVRRYMSKKKVDKLAHEKETFVYGDKDRNIPGCMAKQGITKEQAEDLFEQMMPFAKYGFNKSHAVAYSQIALFTAYLKEYHKEDFYRSSLNAAKSNDEFNNFFAEMEEQSINVLPPSFEKSGNYFTAETNNGQKSIRFGLAMIKGLGEFDCVPADSIQEFIFKNPNASISAITKCAELGMFKQRWLYKDEAQKEIETNLISANRSRLVKWINRYGDTYKKVVEDYYELKEAKAKADLVKDLEETPETLEVIKAYNKAQSDYKNICDKFQLLITSGPQGNKNQTNILPDLETFKNPEVTDLSLFLNGKASPLDRLCNRNKEYDYCNTVFDYQTDLDILKKKTNDYELTFDDLKDKALNIKCFVYTMPSTFSGDKKVICQTKSGNKYRNVKLMDRNGNILSRRLSNDYCEMIEKTGSTFVNVNVTPESTKFFICQKADPVKTSMLVGDNTRQSKNIETKETTELPIKDLCMKLENKTVPEIQDEECIDDI